jgi:hypothetical protein
MKEPCMKKSWIWLLALALVAGWASVETFRLAQATQQAADSQQQQLRVTAKAQASLARNLQVAHSEPPNPGASSEKR